MFHDEVLRYLISHLDQLNVRRALHGHQGRLSREVRDELERPERLRAVQSELLDVARTMRMAFIAYRDHDNKPVWEGHPFTDDVTSIRRFLFDIRITGGADLPEAVLDGLSGCDELEWTPSATREITCPAPAPRCPSSRRPGSS